jgi:transposase
MQLQLDSPKVFVACSPVDFRKGIDGLSETILVEYSTPLTEGIYVFHNKNKNKLKILFWHGNGFVLLQKRLEKGRFTVPLKDENVEISSQQLSWLIAGLDWDNMSSWNELTYNDYF